MNIINGSLVPISAGTNDLGFNFYDIPTRRQQFNINQYQDFLQEKIKNFVKVKQASSILSFRPYNYGTFFSFFFFFLF
jgi:hypothetical protein